jgi:hypothetical protein
MATAAFDLKTWLTEIGIGGDDLSLIETKLAPAAGKIQSGYLAQADYSRKMDEVAKLQRDIEAKDQRLAAEAAEWAGMTATEQAANKTLKASIDKLEGQKLALTQRLRATAEGAGIDPTPLLADLDAAPVTKSNEPAASAVDLSKYVTGEQHAALAGMAVRLPAQLMAIAREHRALTGEDVNEEAIIQEIETRARTRGNQKSLNPREVWEEMHGIPAKRAEKQEAGIQARIDAAKEEGRMEAISQAALPGGSPRGRVAPVFTRAGHGESKLQRPQPGQGISSAVSAFESGKYRQQKSA